ncbi:ras and Rab interactor 3-like [Clarias magur]|uniref:Ras and Rab interactor 3-like n=1 Tax=Clarias magur TaxID=1594786 RepID=A0A8J4WR77_CLAMG|nr:ras and Rab interactor 3-like [Clarias magur]
MSSNRGPFYPERGRRYSHPDDRRWRGRYPHPDEWYQYNARYRENRVPQYTREFRNRELYPTFIQDYQSYIPEWSNYDPYWRKRGRAPRYKSPQYKPRSTSGKRQASIKERNPKQKQGKKQKKQPKQTRRDRKNKKQTEDAQDEKFRALVKKLLELLRSFHHLEKISIHAEEEPPTFTRLTQFLGNVVKPANLTPETKTLLEGNAKNWAYTTRLILQDHYINFIEKESETLQEALIGDWDTALKVAVKWYRRRYPKRHMQEPIKKVEALLLSFDQTERRRDRDTETEMITSDDRGELDTLPLMDSPCPPTGVQVGAWACA